MKKIFIFATILNLLLCSCSSQIPTEVTPDAVANNDQGILCYNGTPYTGKVVSENNGYILVENGIITHVIIMHNIGSIAIDMDIANQYMIFKDIQGNYLTKEDFLSKYPAFKDATDWNMVKSK